MPDEFATKEISLFHRPMQTEFSAIILFFGWAHHLKKHTTLVRPIQQKITSHPQLLPSKDFSFNMPRSRKSSVSSVNRDAFAKSSKTSVQKRAYWSDVRKRLRAGEGMPPPPRGRSRSDSKSDAHAHQSQSPASKRARARQNRLAVTAYNVMPPPVLFELLKYFNETNQSPSKEQREALWAELLFLDSTVEIDKITRWFANRRAYVKRKGM